MMFRKYGQKDYEKLIKTLKEGGYGVVEGKEAVLDKINELAEVKPAVDLDRRLNGQGSPLVRLNEEEVVR